MTFGNLHIGFCTGTDQAKTAFRWICVAWSRFGCPRLDGWYDGPVLLKSFVGSMSSGRRSIDRSSGDV